MPINNYGLFPLSWTISREEITYPQYLSLAAALERDIKSGVLSAGTKLPSQRILADYLDLNFTTVTRAYDLCREKGLIYGETGRGTFVAPQSRYTDVEKSVIELGVVLGFPDVNAQIVEAAREVMTNSYCRDLFSYTDRMGMQHQRKIGVRWMAGRGIETDVDHTTIFAGAQNAITTSLLSLFSVGDALATDTFTYANLIGTAHLAHIRLIPVAGDANGMLPDALDEICTQNNVKGIFLMPYCANPTMKTMDESRRDDLALVCKKHQLIVIEDEASFSPIFRSFYSKLPDQTIYISATTRYVAPGLRVTFCSYPEQYKSSLMNGLYTTSIKASALDAEIMCNLIQSGKANSILIEKSNIALKANQIYNHIFPKDPTSAISHPFFRVHELNQTGNGQGLEQYILSKGIRVCHSYRFAVDKTTKQSFLRISLSSTRDLAELEKGLLRLREIVD
ncbi:MAG: PLP-dependent aminotransferase family protein [Proteobacteria bacterium]|nr:PLP-dependent aminotransferase family protein [Pseudomonadota bacterium]